MTAKQKHLDLKSRYVIEHSLDSSMSFKAIARELGKDCTTISKEIRNHLVFKKSGALDKPFNDCALRFDCDIFQVCQPCVNRSGRPCKFCGRCLSPMSAMAAKRNGTALSKKDFTILSLRRKNMNSPSLNPAPVSRSPKPNWNIWTLWSALFCGKGSLSIISAKTMRILSCAARRRSMLT